MDDGLGGRQGVYRTVRRVVAGQSLEVQGQTPILLGVLTVASASECKLCRTQRKQQRQERLVRSLRIIGIGEELSLGRTVDIVPKQGCRKASQGSAQFSLLIGGL